MKPVERNRLLPADLATDFATDLEMGTDMTTAPERTEGQGGTNFWRLLEVIALHKRMIFGMVSVATLASAIISLLLPQWYRAEALLLPPKEDRLAFSASGSGMAEWASITGGLNLPVMVTPSDVYVRMLGSRVTLDRVIDSFDLIKSYDVKNLTEARMAVEEYADFKVTPEGLILIRYEDKDPVRAAQITNAFVAELDRVNKEIFARRTEESRTFIQETLADARVELDSARAALRSFQELNRTINLDQQTSLTINSAATLKADLGSTEVELSLKRRSLSASHPEVIELSGKVSALKNKISELEFGSSDSSYFSLPVAETPRLMAALAELTTRVRIAENLFENLRLQLNEVRIQEKKEAPNLPVLDPATPPELRFWPKRNLIVGVSFAISLALAIFLALFIEYLAGLERRSPEDFRRASFFLRTVFWRGRTP
ncbi:MAG: hypothetical protein IH914_05390 [candidate division Zixibacteria bacterium]|nr:hypothetical protein [candidate division Zixibacteria bacterium]